MFSSPVSIGVGVNEVADDDSVAIVEGVVGWGSGGRDEALLVAVTNWCRGPPTASVFEDLVIFPDFPVRSDQY